MSGILSLNLSIALFLKALVICDGSLLILVVLLGHYLRRALLGVLRRQVLRGSLRLISLLLSHYVSPLELGLGSDMVIEGVEIVAHSLVREVLVGRAVLLLDITLASQCPTTLTM